jgi:hypothetical protein
MGSITYNFLADSILFNDGEINNLYSSLTDNQLENILCEYRQHCLSNIDDLTKEVTENESSLKVLSSIEEMPYETLKQGALYFDQFVIYDPLFQKSTPRGQATDAMSEYLGFQKHTIDRKGIADTAKLLKSITPMITADFVKILPLSKPFEPPKDIPLNLPINYYADELPKELMQYCRERAIIKSMRQTEKGWQILDEQDLTPGIFVTFQDIESHKGMIYNYFYQELEKTEDPNRFIAKMKLADYPMDKNVWDVWVFQSANSSAKAIVDKIYLENIIANELKATYLTNNLFTANLLTTNLLARETVETASATQFMNIELPFLNRVDIDKLMKIRTFEADVFTNFRTELERQFRELRTVSDPYEIKLRQENIIHELADVQVKKINQKLSSLKRKGFVDATLLLGGLMGTVQTAGWSLLASALATFTGYKTYQDYKDNLIENPSYLLWKVLKK